MIKVWVGQKLCSWGTGKVEQGSGIRVGILGMRLIPGVKAYRYKTGHLTSLGLSVLIFKLGVKIKETIWRRLPSTSLICLSHTVLSGYSPLHSQKCPSLDNKLCGHRTDSSTPCTWVC